MSPSIYGLKKMISICESYAQDYHITFSPVKSKLLCFNVSTTDISPIYLNGTPVTVVNKDKHLGNTISTDIYDRNIISNVCDFYQRSNSVISDFSICRHVNRKKRKSLKIADHLLRLAKRAELPSWGFGGRCEPPNFFDIFNCSKEF